MASETIQSHFNKRFLRELFKRLLFHQLKGLQGIIEECIYEINAR